MSPVLPLKVINYVNGDENSFGNNKMGTQSHFHHSIRENFLGVGALPIQKLGC